jgi:hypothetical protein
MKVDRIVPVEYSLVMVGTPSTPIASWASSTPVKVTERAGRVGASLGDRGCGGGVGWQLVRAKADQPQQALRTLVPAVLVLSFIPDIAIGILGSDHATWGGVVALMAAHVVVAAAAVTSFVIFLPVGDNRS